MHRNQSLFAAALLFSAACSAVPEPYDGRRSLMEEQARDRADADARTPRAEAPGDLDEMLAWARRDNPGLAAAFEDWRAALERVPQATRLPEPRLTFGGYLSEVETRVGPMQVRVGLVQPFPWFGERAAAGNAAYEAAEAAREMLEAVRLELDHRVRAAWHEYVWLAHAAEITASNLELLAHWESVARARMETGIGSHADVVRAQVELGKLEDRLRSLTDLRRPLAARLNAALDRAPEARLPEPPRPVASSAPAPKGPGTFVGLDTEAERDLVENLPFTSPHLLALDHRVLAAQHGVELASKAFYPSFYLGGEYIFVGSADAPGIEGSGDDASALTLGLDLPIWRGSYRAAEREAEARVRAARLAQAETRNRLRADLEMALYELRDADRRVGLFRDSLIPKGEEALSSLDTAYQSGAGGFLDLIDAQRGLLEFQLEAARAEADRATALSAAERITGVVLQPTPAESQGDDR